MQKILAFLLFCSLLFAQNIDELLKQYEHESELSKITKIDTAGYVYIYTRQMLSTMQAYTLADVLKSVPGLNYTITPNYLNLFTYPSSSYISPTAARLYINDHDVTSASFGSALLIWGEMPIEYIDHIEVYKGSAAIEFGDETGIVIIKVYTKLAKRELGNKLRLRADSLGSKSLDAYSAYMETDESSLFLYLHGADTKSKHYHIQQSTISKDKNDFTFYANYSNKTLSIEASHYAINKDPFLGYGRSKRPLGGGLDAKHSYLNINTKLFNIDWNIAYDRLNYKRIYKDAAGVYTTQGYVQDYQLDFTDDIFTFALKKHIKDTKNSLLFGSFYKYKHFQQKGSFDTIHTNFSNSFHLFSIYAEESYSFNKDLLAIFSLKGDFYFYDKDVKDHAKSILRIGVIKNLGTWQLRSFYTKTYFPLQFYALYSQDNMPLKTNPNLKFPTLDNLTFEAAHKKANYTIKYKIGIRSLKNTLLYIPGVGFTNNKNKFYCTLAEINFAYNFDTYNKIYFDIAKGMNSEKKVSPDLQINLRLFNNWNNIEFYNELLYKSSYIHYGMGVKQSFDYTLAMKYKITKDLSFGFRGENIFDKGFRQAYKLVDKTFPITDRRFIFNMEYTF